MLETIERILGRADVTDVMLSPTTGLWVDDSRGLHRVEGVGITEGQARSLAETLLSRGGRRIDYLNPMADARLANGVRVHAVLAPVASSGTSLSIRVARHSKYRLSDLATEGMLDSRQVSVLGEAIQDRRNVLVSGATGSGKTTLLGALLGEVPHNERIVVIEDVTEIRVAHPHVVSLEARQANAEGLGGVGIADLVRQALRMRPDRLVVGECRGPEMLDFLTALNTGHSGGGVTLHANGLTEVPGRLEALAHAHGLDPEPLARLAVNAVDLVVHVDRVGGLRRVVALGKLVCRDARLYVVPRDGD